MAVQKIPNQDGAYNGENTGEGVTVKIKQIILNGVVTILMLILLTLSSCQSDAIPHETPQNAVEYHKITAAQAKKMMDEGQPYILLDVRTDEEWEEKRINGSVLIPDYEIRDRVPEELPDKNVLILVYCRSGRRSADASRELIDMGYTNVYDFGGIIDWPYETVDSGSG